MGRRIEHAASSAAQRQWRVLGSRSLMEARAWMVSLMRRQVGLAAAITDQPRPHAALSRLGRIGHAGRIAGRVGGTVAPFVSSLSHSAG